MIEIILKRQEYNKAYQQFGSTDKRGQKTHDASHSSQLESKRGLKEPHEINGILENHRSFNGWPFKWPSHNPYIV